ncbi:MAG: hypothetical protein ACOYXT_28080 [Bacteroidota bacterium]
MFEFLKRLFGKKSADRREQSGIASGVEPNPVVTGALLSDVDSPNSKHDHSPYENDAYDGGDWGDSGDGGGDSGD